MKVLFRSIYGWVLLSLAMVLIAIVSPTPSVANSKTAKWGLYCSDGTRCYVGLSVTVKTTGDEYYVTFFPVKGQKNIHAGMALQLPGRTVQSKGLTLSSEKLGELYFPISQCNREICIARLGLSKVEFERLASDKEVEIIIALKKSQAPYNSISVPLKGMRRGFQRALRKAK